MTFRVLYKPSTNQARCPYRVVVQETGREIGWINQYLDYETLLRLADSTLKSYAQAGLDTFSRRANLYIGILPRIRVKQFIWGLGCVCSCGSKARTPI